MSPLPPRIMQRNRRDKERDVRRTMESFGYEWTTFDRIQPEDEAFWERYFRDVPLGEVRISRALDAGCGKGRFAIFTAPFVETIVALDGSRAVEAARRNLAERTNASLVRSDVRRMPFVRGSFDLVYCLGVLHHLPDPREGFRAVCDVLAPGGHLLIYVYSRPEAIGVRAAGLAGARLLRLLTRRMHHPLLRWISLLIAGVLWVTFVLPGTLGNRMRIKSLTSLPLQTYRQRPFRSLWLDTFDRLSAPLEARYTWSEIEPWFKEEGIVPVSVREDAGIIVYGQKQG